LQNIILNSIYDHIGDIELLKLRKLPLPVCEKQQPII